MSTNPLLPKLRQDITISKGNPTWNGAPTWLLYDGLRNKFFRIDGAYFELLGQWKSVALDKYIDFASLTLDRQISEEEVSGLIEFLYANSLTQTAASETPGAFYNQAKAGEKNWASKLIHNYIFFRIPLFRPQKLLNALWPFVAPFFSRTAVFVYAALMFLGLYLVSRQWDFFLNTFMDFLTIEGFMTYGFSLVFIKFFHEMGHAFMAKKYDVPVPIIGAAFIVLMPILYTDTTAATKLSDKKKRLMIDLAGIYSELVLATLATLLWIFLPDGPLRSVAFTTATLSWVMSLFVNLNPLMRFDGYYIISDFFGMENLQERGFALARWRLREALFGLNNPAPEPLPKHARSALIFHAWATWIYRFFLFLGIAILVYAFFIKIIGILLFIVEILWFIIAPVFREFKHWWSIREQIFKMKNYLFSTGLLVVVIALFNLPISTKIKVPSIYYHQKEVTLYSPTSAQLIDLNLHEGKFVKKGERLAKLQSQKIDIEIVKIEQQIKMIHMRLSRVSADYQERSSRMVLSQELASKQRELSGLVEQKNKLTLTAPFDGIVTYLDRDLSEGMWVNDSSALATINAMEAPTFFGLVSEMDVDRLEIGAKGYFIPDNGEIANISLVLKRRARVASNIISKLQLADVNGGKVPTVQSDDRKQNGLELRGGWFQLDMDALEPHSKPLPQIISGVAFVEGKLISMGSKMFKRAASILIREFGL